MKCEALSRSLLELLDDRLSDSDRMEAEAHLAQCHECQALVGEHRRAWEMLDEFAPLELSEALDQSLKALSRTKPTKHWRILSIVAGIAATAIIGFLVWIQNSKSTLESDGNLSEESDVIAHLDLLLDYDLLNEFSLELEARHQLELMEVLKVGEEVR